MGNFLGRLLVKPSAAGNQLKLIQTERAIIFLVRVLIFISLVIAVCGLSYEFTLNFILWGLLVAIGSCLIGMIIGLLFGLPNVQTVAVAESGGTDQAAVVRSLSAGYRESTNLESVANWLTTIIIGLSLVQYWTLQQAMEKAFQFASALMTQEPDTTAAPAAIISIAAAACGFLISYLAMRRYFISEMVAGKADSQKILDEYLSRMQHQGLVQKSSITATETPANMAVVTAERAAELASRDSVKAATALAASIGTKKVDYPDDPWRGKFGESAEKNGAKLSAIVRPYDEKGEYFKIILSVTSTIEKNRAGQSATFYLHPTFGSDLQKVAFGQDNVATLELVAYGAFTVGVLLEDGTQLELNLATLPDVPPAFLLR